jgi:hypothetical protein
LAVLEEDRAVAKAAFVQQFEVQAHVREGALAGSHYYRCQTQVVLVHQRRFDRVRRELGPPILRSPATVSFSQIFPYSWTAADWSAVLAGRSQ